MDITVEIKDVSNFLGNKFTTEMINKIIVSSSKSTQADQRLTVLIPE